MTHSRLSCSLGAVALLLGPGPAAGSQRPSPLPPGSWNVDWGEHRCSLIRQDESSPPNYFALQITPGSHRADLRVVSRHWPEGALSDPDRLTLSFEPQGAPVAGRARDEQTEAGRALVIFDVAGDVRHSLAAARSVRVARDGVTLIEIAVPSSPRALAAFRDCETTIMRQWGIDPAAHAAVAVPPRGNLAAFVTHGDYPLASLSRESQGIVVFRLDLDGEGRAVGCDVLVSSGDQALDATTCRIMRQRARLEPARDAQGRPIPTTYVSSITWRILSTGR
jgi:TonB family protein